MYRFVASDMDETFLNHNHSIPEANIQAVYRLKELGVSFVPCSGRPYDSVVGSLEPIRDCLDYVISYNGACINRIGENDPIQAHDMPFSTIQTLFKHGVEIGIGMHVYQMDGRVWCWQLDDSELHRIDGLMNIALLPSPSIDFLEDVPMAKILYYSPSDEYLHAEAAAMANMLPANVATTFSSGRYLEFVRSDIDKGTGIADLAHMLHISLDDVIACGDAPNDDAMIQAAGVGVVVSNADPQTAALASYRAQASCDDGVLAEVLKRFIEPQHHSNQV